MASNPYKPISWSDGEPIDKDKLNQMASNDQYLFERMPSMFYNAHGVKKTTGVKILAGKGTVPKTSSKLSYATIYFGSFFSQGCRPIVIAIPVQNSSRTRFDCSVRGIGVVYPDHRGVQIGVTTDERLTSINYHAYNLPVYYIAIGW